MLNQNQTVLNNELLLGGWTAFHPLTTNDQQVFNEALKGFVGVNYTPIAVSTQVVAGMNYRYKCTAQLPGSGMTWDAIVEIFAPLDGMPYITGIVRI